MALSLAPATIVFTPSRSLGQTLAACDPPATGEYLLLVATEARDRLDQVLPAGATSTRCRYQERTVVRVGNFADEELASSWAEYLTTVEAFPTTVVRPPDSPTDPGEATPVRLPGEAEDARSPSYEPVSLGAGYAVLIHYFDRAETAAAVQTALNAPVGLAVYEHEPYLLAAYTNDIEAAGRLLMGLSDRQFSALIVDSRQVVMLTPTVAVPPAQATQSSL